MAEIRIDDRTVLVRATMDHAIDVSARMRQADVDECYASCGLDPLPALRMSLNASEYAFAAIHDGRPEVMWGVVTASALTGLGVPWLLGTPVVEANTKRFLRQSMLWRDDMVARYTRLANYVDDRNVVSKRWLKWLGFTIGDASPMGYEGRPFRPFSIERTA